MWELVRDGYRLLKHWPVRRSLMLRFPLTQTVLLAKGLLYYLPGMTFAWLLVSFNLNHQSLSPLQGMMALLMLSLPLQGLLWLGREGRKPLSPGDRHWLAQLSERMKGQGIKPSVKLEGARYLELALAMEQAFSKGDKAFGRTE
ncbi:DUF412 domain-containing protein [Gallaecimonas pentaromativorans]|uniref:UPF0208 membrane protein YfbV n=1 Tax=Gallaecimonas pentaromativorans TaxID=584787 RepID=A0A3N1PCA6_9GAMM|nr:DUF412 family protein [Gallaecimonas pentaromativorans]MED5525758.1 DUF412 family protein [Pseudomonadota bacterium]ROQ25011.1 hypothetical protein EDC28_106261 [Gallaecimonas pentaromativorans]